MKINLKEFVTFLLCSILIFQETRHVSGLISNQTITIDEFERGRNNDNLDHRNNYCEVYKQVELGIIKRRNALKGLNVSVGIQEQELYLSGQNSIAIKVFDEVSRRAKFNYEDSYSAVLSIAGN